MQCKDGGTMADLGKKWAVPTKLEDMNVLTYASKAWTTSARALPIFYREGIAALNGIRAGSVFSDFSKFPLYCWSDQRALKWAGASHKGLVSEFAWNSIKEHDVRMGYVKGDDNVADAPSRRPFLAEDHPQTGALDEMLSVLLENLPERCKSDKTAVFLQQDTRRGIRAVQAWRGSRAVIDTWSPRPKSLLEQLKTKKTELLIVQPRVQDAPVVLKQLKEAGVAFAVLLPTDLAAVVSTLDGRMEADVEDWVRGLGKLAFVATTPFMWCTNIPEVRSNVYAQASIDTHECVGAAETESAGMTPVEEMESELAVEANLADMRADAIPPVETWASAQTPMLDKYKKSEIAIRGDGVAFYIGPKGSDRRILVPEGVRQALVVRTHCENLHMAGGTVYRALSDQYIWPGMRTDVRNWVRQCTKCLRAEMRRAKSHGQYRPRTVKPRFTDLAFDLVGMGKAGTGEDNVLVVIDMTTRYVWMIAQEGRGAELTARNLYERVFMQIGLPRSLLSDSAPEFTGKVMAELSKLVGAGHIFTDSYNPAANGVCERINEITGHLWRCIDDDGEYRRWPRLLQGVAFALNTVYRPAIDATPFEVVHGVKARTFLDVLAMNQDEPEGVPHDESSAAAASDLALVVERTRAFADVAARTTEYIRRRETARLNRKGHKVTPYEVGSYVRIYKPPSAEQIADRGRKAKHLQWYSGPYQVIWRSEDGRHYRVRRGSDTFARSLLNILPWHGEAGDEFLHDGNAIQVGEHMAVRDSNTGKESKRFYVVEVTKVDSERVYYRVYGSTAPMTWWKGERAARVEFKPMRVRDDGRWGFAEDPVVSNPAVFADWTGDLALKDMGLILVRHLRMTEGHTLDQESIDRIKGKEIKDLTHQRMV